MNQPSRLSAAAGGFALLLAGAAAGAGIVTADADYWLPNPFAWMALALCAGWLLTMIVRRPGLRAGLRAAIAMPIIAFLFLELWAGSGQGTSDRIVTVDDGLLRYHYAPGWHGTDPAEVAINDRGLWDHAYPIPKPDGVTRIAILGDSVPNDPSIPFPERFHSLVEASLGENHDVVNVSCEGYNTLQEVRLLERVGLEYEPDVVVLTYVLNDPFIQNGGDRRIGHSAFLFHALAGLAALSGRDCRLFSRLHEGYGFDLMVRAPLERLALLSRVHGFDVLVAPLPIITRSFEDPVCAEQYAKVQRIAESLGFGWVPVNEAFHGLDPRDYRKPGPPDPTHPNAAGHRRMATALTEALKEHLEERVDQGRGGLADEDQQPDQDQGEREGHDPPSPVPASQDAHLPHQSHQMP